ncbi:TPA: hypothetical protein ACH3X1_009595 [Trebouxia sp. C0004]
MAARSSVIPLGRVTHLGSQLLPVSDRQLTVGEHVTDVAVPQQSQRAGLSKQLLQGMEIIPERGNASTIE